MAAIGTDNASAFTNTVQAAGGLPHDEKAASPAVMTITTDMLERLMTNAATTALQAQAVQQQQRAPLAVPVAATPQPVVALTSVNPTATGSAPLALPGTCSAGESGVSMVAAISR